MLGRRLDGVCVVTGWCLGGVWGGGGGSGDYQGDLVGVREVCSCQGWSVG